jgi:imidazoleglycerol phosphate dehydratase HisB
VTVRIGLDEPARIGLDEPARIGLDEPVPPSVHTGLPFFGHMLSQRGKHGRFH